MDAQGPAPPGMRISPSKAWLGTILPHPARRVRHRPSHLVASHWPNFFGSLDKNELQPVDGRSVFFFDGFTVQGVGLPDKKQYDRSGKADALDVTESTTIHITFMDGTQ